MLVLKHPLCANVFVPLSLSVCHHDQREAGSNEPQEIMSHTGNKSSPEALCTCLPPPLIAVCSVLFCVLFCSVPLCVAQAVHAEMEEAYHEKDELKMRVQSYISEVARIENLMAAKVRSRVTKKNNNFIFSC